MCVLFSCSDPVLYIQILFNITMYVVFLIRSCFTLPCVFCSLAQILSYIFRSCLTLPCMWFFCSSDPVLHYHVCFVLSLRSCLTWLRSSLRRRRRVSRTTPRGRRSWCWWTCCAAAPSSSPSSGRYYFRGSVMLCSNHRVVQYTNNEWL